MGTTHRTSGQRKVSIYTCEDSIGITRSSREIDDQPGPLHVVVRYSFALCLKNGQGKQNVELLVPPISYVPRGLGYPG